jgi:molybdopterin converting factor small subunit
MAIGVHFDDDDYKVPDDDEVNIFSHLFDDDDYKVPDDDEVNIFSHLTEEK